MNAPEFSWASQALAQDIRFPAEFQSFHSAGAKEPDQPRFQLELDGTPEIKRPQLATSADVELSDGGGPLAATQLGVLSAAPALESAEGGFNRWQAAARHMQ
jgi:hypothetical protein